MTGSLLTIGPISDQPYVSFPLPVTDQPTCTQSIQSVAARAWEHWPYYCDDPETRTDPGQLSLLERKEYRKVGAVGCALGVCCLVPAIVMGKTWLIVTAAVLGVCDCVCCMLPGCCPENPEDRGDRQPSLDGAEFDS